MKSLRIFSAVSAAAVFGAVAMVAQTLLLRRFLWRFESTETGVSLFLSCWLFASGMGAALACTPLGRKAVQALSHAVWLLVAACVALYFAQYALIENLRSWMGVPEHQTFPLAHLAAGCFVANVPFGLVAGLVVPTVCCRLNEFGGSLSRAFAWEALGAAVGGLAVTALLVRGVVPDPRDETEWFRFFPQATERPGRFETGSGTTFFGTHGGSFYALSSGGVREVIPEGDRSVDVAALVLSQRPYAKSVLLLGHVPLAVGLALEKLRPDLPVVWCPCDAQYGVELLEAACGHGLQTRVRAAGETPQRFLEQQADASFDCSVVVPPSATTLEGASWCQGSFAQRVRRVTARTGVALFGLDCDAAALTPEACARLEGQLGALRQAWPESGVFAAGAGGWWIASRVPRLAYDAETAVTRFALLKSSLYPAEALRNLYDPQRALRLSQQCPLLNPDTAVLLSGRGRVEDAMALGLADAIRRGYPDVASGDWLAWFKRVDGARLLGLLLVVLWMAPVALGGRAQAPRRLLAAWLAASGALGLAVSLAVLYSLQMRFGALYLLAGMGSCLYLAGLFCGNRLGSWLVVPVRGQPRNVRGLMALLTLAQAGLAMAVLYGAERTFSAVGMIVFCFVAGCGAGTAVPTALAAYAEQRNVAATMVLADAVGSALGGVFFAVLVPLAGLHEAVAVFAMLVCGIAVGVVASGSGARLTAGLALVVSLTILGGRLRDTWYSGQGWGALPTAGSQASEPPAAAPASAGRVAPELRGIPRKIDADLIRKQMQAGTLATNAAAFWNQE